MRRVVKKLGSFPTLLLGIGLVIIGLSTLNYIVDSWWPFDVNRADLVRDTALFRVESTALLDAANWEIVFAFLAAVMVTLTGAVLPLVFILNRRFGRHPERNEQ